MLYREDLDEIVRENPDCPDGHESCEIYCHARCHPEAATWVVFAHGCDHIHVVCAECEAPVAEIAVASRLEPLQRLLPPTRN